MGKPKQQSPEEIDPLLVVAFRSLGLPRSAWPGNVAKMSDKVVADLKSTVADGNATPNTRVVYQKWQSDRHQKVSTAKPIQVKAGGEQRTAIVSPTDGTLVKEWK
jgi:hypothetical protein